MKPSSHNMSERKVLLIAYFFPPLGGAGVQRSVKFAKYLPDFGWQPVVLTGRHHTSAIDDETLEAELPDDLTVLRAPALRIPKRLPWRLRQAISRWFLIVDEQIGWLPFATRSGLQAAQKHDIRMLYSTSSPYTDHLVGLRLKKRLGAPWIADFRDPWIGNMSLTFPTTFHRKISERLEKRVLTSADRVIVVSEPMKRDLQRRYPDLPSERIRVIANGYDPQDFHGLLPAKKDPKRMLIVYSGSFYTNLRTPQTFLRGVRRALETGRLPADHLAIRFVGNLGAPARQEIERHDLQGIVEPTGYLSHDASIQHVTAADLLLLIIHAGPGSEAIYTGKIFEYLAARRPVLALVPPGVAADLIREARAGVVVDPDDEEAVASTLASLYNRWEAGQLQCESVWEVVRRYDRRKLTGELAQMMDELAQPAGQESQQTSE